MSHDVVNFMRGIGAICVGFVIILVGSMLTDHFEKQITLVLQIITAVLIAMFLAACVGVFFWKLFY